ncbi:MAG: Uma2 family endonuclease [Acidobacteriota bacterium]
MATTAAITLDELARMPEDGLRHEIDAGELLVMTRPKLRHGKIQGKIFRLIGNFVEAGRLGEVVPESGFILGRDPDILRGPDVAFVCHERLKDVSEDGWPELGPDLVVEVVSPSDTARQIDRKVHQYLAAGTLAVWVVYPDTKSVQVFEPGSVVRLVEGDGLLSSPQALAGFEIRVREIFI